MKKLLTIIFIFSALLSVAQKPMVVEEYNYITKGIKIQEEAGLDVKKGYSIKDLFTTSTNDQRIIRSTTFKAIYRDGEKKPFAFLCIYKNLKGDFIDYFCIPAYETDTEFWSKTYEIMQEYDEYGKLCIMWGLSHLAGYVSNSDDSQKTNTLKK